MLRSSELSGGVCQLRAPRANQNQPTNQVFSIYCLQITLKDSPKRTRQQDNLIQVTTKDINSSSSSFNDSRAEISISARHNKAPLFSSHLLISSKFNWLTLCLFRRFSATLQHHHRKEREVEETQSSISYLFQSVRQTSSFVSVFLFFSQKVHSKQKWLMTICMKRWWYMESKLMDKKDNNKNSRRRLSTSYKTSVIRSAAKFSR